MLKHKMDVLDLVVREQKVNAGAIVVFTRLLHHYNITSGKCYPSIETIARATGFTVRTVSTHVRALEEAEYIVVHRHGRKGSNRYELTALGGKMVCSPSETLRKKQLPKTSGKPLKNPKDNPSRAEAKRVLASVGKPTDHRQDAKKEANVEAALVQAFGGGEEGLAKLCSIPTWIVEEAKRCHLVDDVPCADAVKAAMKTIRALEEGQGERPAAK
ncbi:helix-turn-helix domain-containing protein [Tabrizicola sp.]|uniref:helix-turn-helix domain-containing protein n=1 Tax=Tabrizicola sp. TaxID=2005166 RepID=UPI0035B4A032